MAPIKQKIIQKRVKRRERFSRMAKLRHRKHNPVFTAKSEVLADIEKCKDDTIKLHQYSPGMILGEKDGRINTEPSMINKNYIANQINIIKEGDTKIVQLKLIKKGPQINTPSNEILEKWEKSGLSGWTERFRKFQTTYNNFLMKHKEKFLTGNLSEEDIKRYEEYQQKRREINATRNCVEIKVCFNLEEDYISEKNCNTGAITILGYDIDEFVDKNLREGIPKIVFSDSDNGELMGKVMDNFETVFEKTLELKFDQELRLMGKDQKMVTGKLSILITGYFLRNKAELSYLYIIDSTKPLEVNKQLIESFHMPTINSPTGDYQERKTFLEKYYNKKIDQPTCGFKEIEIPSSKIEEDCDKIETEDNKISEEICNQEINEKIEYESENNQNNQNKCLNHMTCQYKDISTDNSPNTMLQGSYNTMLQSYMYMFPIQSGLFNYGYN